MKIAIIGYGKMGKAIENIALNRGHEIVFRASSDNPITNFDFNNCDVAIEFTTPDTAIPHINYCLENKTPIVVGTTAWGHKLSDVKELVNKHHGALLYASNFSVGVNIFFELSKKLSSLLSSYPSYKAHIEETHHTQKLDAPSGTAVKLADDIIETNASYKKWKLGEEEIPYCLDGTLPVASYRKPNVPGDHKVAFSSSIDTITLSHQAHNRMGFALGAVLAAEWLIGKKGIFTMSNVLNID